MAILLKDLAGKFGGDIFGDENVSICGIASLEDAQYKDISFISNRKYLSQVQATKAGAIIISEEDFLYCRANYPQIQFNALLHKNSYATFARIAQYFLEISTKSVSEHGFIHSLSNIHPDAKIAKSAKIGAFCTVESGAEIGENVLLQANCYIGENVKIGNDSKLYANVSIYHGCIIGSKNIVHSGVVIGSDGFGFAPDLQIAPPQTPEWVKIPQVGIVCVEDNVEIGANTTIDRATFGVTKIGFGTKIDNQVQIAHNVVVGKYCVIAGCTAVAGSTKIGDFCIIGGSSQIAGHLNIASGTVVSGGTGVMQSTTKASRITGVFPAMEHKLWEKNAATLRQLQNMRKQIKILEAKIK